MRVIKSVMLIMAFAPFISAALAEEPYATSSKGADCGATPPASSGGGGESPDKYRGYTQFPIDAPQRYKKQANPRDVLPEDKSFMEGLRMLLGVGTAANPNCLRKRSFSGLLDDGK